MPTPGGATAHHKDDATMWRLPIPFCLPLFRFGLTVGLAAAAIGAFLPWIIPVSALAAIMVSPRLADWTDIVSLKGPTYWVRLSAAESVARRFRHPHRVRVNLAVSAATRTIVLVAGLAFAAMAVLPDATLDGLARWVRATSYWRLCYVDGLPLPDGGRLVGHPDAFHPVIGTYGLLWPPLCAFLAAAVAVALPLWLGAMSRGFESVQGHPGWPLFGSTLLGALFQLPLSVFALFAVMTGFGPHPAIGEMLLSGVVQPVAWGYAIARLANLGTILAVLLSGRQAGIEW